MDRVGGAASALMLAVVTAMGGPAPQQMHDLVWVSFWFVLMDTLTGVWAAALEGRARSGLVIRKLVGKLVQYSIAVVLAMGVGALVDTWGLAMAAFGAVISIETMSLIENMVRLEKTGVNMGPFKPLLDRVSKYLAVAQVDEEKKP
jgi:phage-related holin